MIGEGAKDDRRDEREALSRDDGPLPEKLLEATEDRMREVLGEPESNLEVFREAAPATRLGSVRERAAERLKRNSREAVAARLRRMKISAERLEGGPEKLGAPEEAFPREALDNADIINGLERVIGRNNLLDVKYLDRGQLAAQSVGRILVPGRAGGLVPIGTGFLVSPRLLLTNNHVIGSVAEARSGVVEFNFQNGPDGEPRASVRFALDPDAFFTTSPSQELDFTVVAVRDGDSTAERLANFGYKPLVAMEGEILDGESVNIVQHPNGEPKQVALRENFVLRLPTAQASFLHYETDTTPGSSGSPVYNDEWEVVALHHSGVPRRDGQGRILAVDGQVWTRSMGEHRVDWIANEGVRVVAIVERLRSLGGLDDDRRRLLEVALRTVPTTTSQEPAESPNLPAESGMKIQPRLAKSTEVDSSSFPSVSSSSGASTWHIPMRVTVQFGAPSLETIPKGPSVTIPVEAPDDDELAEARAELDRAAGRVYYDAEADGRAREAYYRNLAPDSEGLFVRLSELLRSTHRNQPRYKPSKHVYPWVDLQPNRKLKSVYSGLQFDPLEFIRRDIETERVTRESIAAFITSEGIGDPRALEARIRELEASQPFNCEHVVPQSWFAAREPMRGDLHHLFACESGCNSFRGNTPYFDFPDFEEAIRSQCGKREGRRFEPSSGKGAVARATLYFLLRYPGGVSRATADYTDDRLGTLAAWHKDFPPDEYERHRNQAIFEIQGNRNPLIDFPAWVDKIDFRLGLG